MKYTFLLVLLIFTFSFLSTSAQQNHFIYFQTENRQPFYVKLDNKILSSSSSGYLILPKLKDGDYLIKFGSTKNEWPEQTINCKLNKDAGYIFKNFGEKGWGLFNLQSLDVIIAGHEKTNNNTPTQEIKDDDFSKMLANVVNDSTIKEKDIVIKEEVKETPKQNVEAAVEAVTPQASHQEIEAPILNSIIKRDLKVKNKDGMELVYTDEYNNKKDTIRIFIPPEKVNEQNEIKPAEPAAQTENKTDSDKINSQPGSIKTTNQTDTSESMQLQAALDKSSEAEQKKDTVESISKDISQSDVKDTTESIIMKNTSQPTLKEDKTVKEDEIELLPAKSGKINPDCKGYAAEEDFLKLRRKMAAESNEENMIKVAKKVFKTKCFTTEYIKNLSALFLKDEAKYNFFDAAYSYVSDSGIFSTLENQLSDPYYIKRFKAMIHQ